VTSNTKGATRAKFHSRVENVTPEMAEKWLEERNTNNRKLSEPLKDRTVEAYARDMRANRWHLTGDAIKFDTDKVLLDGQHRLWACVIAEQAFETLVAYNVDPDARIVIDTGKKRTLGHYLQMGGEASANQLAAIVNLCFRWDAGNINGDGTIKGARGRLVVTHEDALTWLEQNEGARDSVGFGRMFQRDVKFGATSAGAAHLINSRVDAEAADEFWTLAASGEGLESGSSVLALRRWAVNVATARARSAGQIGTELALVYCLKAMQLWRAGRSVRVLHVKAGEGVEVWGS
jgi:hypothetical protein